MDDESLQYLREKRYVIEAKPLRADREHADHVAAIRALVRDDVEVIERRDGSIWIAR